MILDRIVYDKRLYLESAKKIRPADQFNVDMGRERRSLMGSIESAKAQGRPAIIAEVKRRSPSGGSMGSPLSITELASLYEAHGAVGISVLTDEKYFGGSPDDLGAIRAVTGLPVLRKEFVIDEYQIYEAAACGADAFLLIATILDDDEIARFVGLARELGLEVLIESHTKDELERSIRSGARLLGINNRDLDTLTTDLATSEDLLPMVPNDRLAISESGIRNGADIERLMAAGADGFLIGESLLKSGDPGAKLDELMFENTR